MIPLYLPGQVIVKERKIKELHILELEKWENIIYCGNRLKNISCITKENLPIQTKVLNNIRLNTHYIKTSVN